MTALRRRPAAAAIGVVVGVARDDLAGRIRELPGVADVSPETPVSVGPPDEPQTW